MEISGVEERDCVGHEWTVRIVVWIRVCVGVTFPSILPGMEGTNIDVVHV